MEQQDDTPPSETVIEEDSGSTTKVEEAMDNLAVSDGIEEATPPVEDNTNIEQVDVQEVASDESEANPTNVENEVSEAEDEEIESTNQFDTMQTESSSAETTPSDPIEVKPLDADSTEVETLDPVPAVDDPLSKVDETPVVEPVSSSTEDFKTPAKEKAEVVSTAETLGDAKLSVREQLQADLRDVQGKSEEELKLIRTLLLAEESHDAVELLDAQDGLLTSKMAEGIEEIAKSPGIQNAKAVRESIQAAPFKPHQADFGELARPSSIDSSEKTESPVKAEVATGIPKDGLNDEECAAFVGSYEENELVNQMLQQLDMKTFEEQFVEDQTFKKEFRWWATACLRSRRYRLGRGVELLENYAKWRKVVKYTEYNTTKLKSHLETGFCVFMEEARCVDGRAILLIRLALHDPKVYSAFDVVMALHNIIAYALRTDDQIQARGFTILHDMSGMRYRNLDYSLAEQITRCFNSTFPMRFGRIVMYNPPFFFSAVFRIISVFLSRKMKQRMVKVSKHKKNPAFVTLAKYVDQTNLPSYMGGGQDVASGQFALNVVSGLYPISKSLEKTISH